ncbi:neck protein [Sinorhizobium phage phiM7]|uniref:Neck protein n=2 Tax=Emdodecavirus TaxID=1980937 RepID=S5MPJ2_9CAUD|nr:head closure Hc2 [Sinorhizobium phage phiM12]YP_009601210.1 head closure Hc2 [Sinorhizobium phage phiM7]AGR47750.1 neck protein [Sinorhizobium phage phiM12]AKF12632.1 neck protein [Sinorhizobium phage phiM7]AKF12992.1 neck protein [Sinorhizobium phage phiM19]
MATNPYINNFFATNEQKLVDDLAIEFIKFYGIDCLYLPRTVTTADEILHEDSRAVFDQVKIIEMYVKNVEGFGGDGDFMSKFGLQIRDSMTLSVSITRCKEELGANRRPMEGDLIYFPLNKKMFEISHVEHEAVFYQNGSLQFYDLKADLYEYSNETFATGNATIDTLFSGLDTSTPEAVIDLGSVDPIADNEIIQEFAEGILDFSDMDPYSSDGRW